MKKVLISSLMATAGLAVLSASPAAAWKTRGATAVTHRSAEVNRVAPRRTAVLQRRPAYAYAARAAYEGTPYWGYGPMWPGYAPYRAAYAPPWFGSYGAAYAPPFGYAPYGEARAAATLAPNSISADGTAAVVGNHTIGHDPDPNVRENMIRNALS